MAWMYLSAARGDVQLHALEAAALGRLRHLQALLRAGAGTGPVYCEHALEGSVLDNVAHHALHALAALSGHADLAGLVRRGEAELFRRRLAALAASDLRSFAHKIVRFVNKLTKTEPYLDCVRRLCEMLMLKAVARHVAAPHETGCTLHSVRVDFKHCLPLVATRRVELEKGEAKIFCGRWKQFLLALYETHLRSRFRTSRDLTVLRSDPRLMDIISKLLKVNFTRMVSTNVLGSKDVDEACKYFPPCMQNLHRMVRKHHRLSHDQRFHYSLFLKDIGLPLEEAIDFWRSEYRHPSETSACAHSWAKDEKKYIYGIRHLYGLEGGRKSYSSVSCARIQGTTNSRTEGGCPFKNFDEVNLRNVLNADFVSTESFMMQVINLKSSDNCRRACHFYLTTVFPITTCDKSSHNGHFNLSPVNFFRNATLNSIM